MRNNNGTSEGLPFRMPNPNETTTNNQTSPRVHEYEESEMEESDIESQDDASSYEEIGISSIDLEQTNRNEQGPRPRHRRSGAEIQVLLETLRHLQPGRGSMPMPTSDQAPRFKGKNLQRFLDDY